MNDDPDKLSPRDYLPPYLKTHEERQLSPDITAEDVEAYIHELMEHYGCSFEELPGKISEARRREAESN
jgi:hypothetical protein